MFSRTQFASILGIAALALSACSSQDNEAASTPTTGSSTTSVAQESTSPSSSAIPSTEPSRPTADHTPTTETSSVEPAPEETKQAVDNVIASPGTNCGPATVPAEMASADVYVSGGNVSCDEAVAVVNEYIPLSYDAIVRSRDAVVEGLRGGYTCHINRGRTGADVMLSGQRTLCTNPVNGAYIELRDTGQRILPGYVADAKQYIDFDEDTRMPTVSFSTPAQNIDCSGTVESNELHCRILAPGMVWNVTIAQSGEPTVTEQLDSPVGPVTATSVDVGTVITALGVSCKPTAEQSLYCVNASHGFTMSSSGFSLD